MSDDLSSIGLADAITALRAELKLAVERAPQEDEIKLSLKDIEVEFQLVAERKNTGKGGGEIGFKLFGHKIGANAEYSREWGGSRTHTLRFRLEASNVKTEEKSLNFSIHD